MLVKSKIIFSWYYFSYLSCLAVSQTAFKLFLSVIEHGWDCEARVDEDCLLLVYLLVLTVPG